MCASEYAALYFGRARSPWNGRSLGLGSVQHRRALSIHSHPLPITGTLLGPSVGLVKPETGTLIGNWLAFPGQLFLATIQMIVIPLVIASVVRGLAASEDLGAQPTPAPFEFSDPADLS